MTTVVIFTRTLRDDGYPFSDDYHWNAYLDLLLELKSQGAQAYFASGNETYAGNGVFQEAYTTDTKVRVRDFKRFENVKADVVLEKGGFEGSGVLVINPKFVHEITASKSETYRNFAKYQPRSVICADQAAVERAAQEIPGNLIVVKEPVSNAGRAVQIGPKAEVLAKLPPAEAYPLVVQEFIDTSVGVPGYVEGIHDVRVKIGGGEIFGGMIRTPAPGELRANLALGGSIRHLLPEELPPQAVELAREIDCFFEKYPRYYAIDFANTPQGWKLIELNSKPGLSPVSAGAQAERIIQKLAEYLIKIAPKA